MKIFLYFIGSHALLLASLFAQAANMDIENDWTLSAKNDIASISKQLEIFDSSSSATDILTTLDKQLSEHILKAQQCVDQEMPKAEKSKVEAAVSGNSNSQNSAPQAHTVFDELTNKAGNQLKECQEILLNAQNLSSSIHTLQTKILAEYLLSRGSTAYASLKRNLASLDPIHASLQRFVDTRVLTTAFDRLDWSLLLVSIMIAWLAGRLLGKTLLSLASHITSKRITGSLIAASYACLGRSLPLLLPAVTASIVFAALLPISPLPVSVALFSSLTIYLLTIIAARILLKPCPPSHYFFVLDESFSASLYKRLQFLLLLGMLSVLGYSTNLREIITQPQWELARACFMILTIVNLVWLISQLSRVPGLIGSALTRVPVSLILLVALGAELAGYRNLASYLFKGTIGSILLAVALWLIYAVPHDILDSLNEGRHRWGRRFRKKLQLEKNQHIPGLLWIRVLSVILVWTFFIISMLNLWRYSDTGWAWFLQVINEGFEIGSSHIVPLQIVLGFGLFAVLLTLVRWFRQNTLPKWVGHTNLDHGGREAVVTISGYIGVIFAGLLGLSVAGFDFTSLALIAGALSVGIGFGLQNIVNNFVSGIILLFERPIRTGDWIVVGNTEGYVRKISIRSTQIETFDRADVIVPNSELISNQVTNWMLHDAWGRITVPVGVAYGSDVRKVEKVLIDCATQHPLVIKDSTVVNAPRVLFRSFGDSSLNFELRCFISDVDKRLSTSSDLNFAIELAMRENNISIPFPQRDLHLRSVDPSIMFTNKKSEAEPE